MCCPTRRASYHRGDSAEALLTRIVGWPIPIDALRSWMFVMPTQDAAFRYALDADMRVQLIEQLGWVIEYSSYREYNGEFMPRKIVASKMLFDPNYDETNSAADPKVVVKLITKSWN